MAVATPEISLLNQRETAKERRIEQIKPFLWKPGIPSPNPGGRPKNEALPLSNGYRHALKTVVPKQHPLRIAFEKTTHLKLEGKVTLDDLLANMMVWSVTGEHFKKLNLPGMVEVRTAVEGREAPRAFVERSAEQEGEANEPIDMRDRILLGFVKVMKERMEIYNIHDEQFDEIEKEALRREGLAEWPSQDHGAKKHSSVKVHG